jgi:ribosome-associated protein
VQVICDEERSQYLNKEIALERLIVLTNALHKPKVRKKLSRGKQGRQTDHAWAIKKCRLPKKENRRKRNFDIN